MAARPVAVVGSFNQDFVWHVERFNAPGETQLGRFDTGPGGKGSNQAIACARLGAPTRFVAALGDDAIAAQARALFDAEGIDARIETHAQAMSGSAAILIDASAQNMIVVGAGANALLSSAHVEAERAAIESAAVLLTQHEVNPDATRRALEIAGAAGVLRIHNPAPTVVPAAAAPLDQVDVLTPNESEFADLLRAHAGLSLAADGLHALGDDDLHALCLRLPPPRIVLTLGARGAFVSDAGTGDAPAGRLRVPARPVVARDTTGAGDAFNAGLAVALAEGQPLDHAVHFATRVAALQVQREGAARGMPSRSEVEREWGIGNRDLGRDVERERGTGNGEL
ncbi:ribokinase [Coralloluteibacterium thermophilus]|uniref:Ribokinase n=1 Tax=Coralloluteibacterium thermophilum TaxID=2707049 RepID=A0ABV9NJS4_9GAMM